MSRQKNSEIIAELKAEIEQLKKENAELQKQNTPPSRQPTLVDQMIPKNKDGKSLGAVVMTETISEIGDEALKRMPAQNRRINSAIHRIRPEN